MKTMESAQPHPPPDVSEVFVRELTDHQSPMLAFIRTLAPGSPSARDLLQEVNVILWQRRDQFVPGTNFRAWAFQTIRYHLMNHRRRLASRGWLIFDDEVIARVAPALESDSDEIDVRHDALRHCLAKLRPKDRELLQHRYASGAPLKEYAQAIHRSAGTLKATLFALRAALRRCIERRIHDQGLLPP